MIKFVCGMICGLVFGGVCFATDILTTQTTRIFAVAAQSVNGNPKVILTDEDGKVICSPEQR
jgi:hypothetical protein